MKMGTKATDIGSQKPRTIRPVAVGTGLVALDLVLSEVSGAPPRHWAGGTCGNVLAALAYLGWRAVPIARLQPGVAAKRICEDLTSWGVSDRFLDIGEDGSTPVIVERIAASPTGGPRHSFSWRCPSCGTPFPPYKPILVSVAETISPKLTSPRIFLFDRVSPGALYLARACAERGALVFFEPSSVSNALLFRQAWEIAHVVKYSHERLRELPEVGVDDGPRLLVETLGEAGLRFCNRITNRRSTVWEESPGFPVANLKDAAGSGDWCTAGFLSQVGGEGLAALLRMTPDQLRKALRFGQALAAWNCGFEGPRGGMYGVTRREFERQLAAILGSDESPTLPARRAPRPPLKVCPELCPACGQDEGAGQIASGPGG
ncbi:MAG TPA: carbohydrate kinase family protein [Gemmataceae bacterium]|jgi:fructokinase